MSNIRLFHPENIIDNSTSLLSKEHTHYVVNVMRLKRGSSLNFFNKNGEWNSEIVFLDKDRVNTALSLEEMGVLDKFGVEMIGAKRDAIEMAEDRALFRDAMDRIGLEGHFTVCTQCIGQSQTQTCLTRGNGVNFTTIGGHDRSTCLDVVRCRFTNRTLVANVQICRRAVVI